MAKHLTKYTVQEVLNKENNFEEYASARDDSIDLTGTPIVSSITFPTTYGSATIFDKDDPYSKGKLVYSKVEVESSGNLYIQLGTGGSVTSSTPATFGDIIYVEAALLPITFTGYGITDLKIYAASTPALGIIAWR